MKIAIEKVQKGLRANVAGLFSVVIVRNNEVIAKTKNK